VNSERNKRSRIRKLVHLRRLPTSCPFGYSSLSTFDEGYYESVFVVPWTKSACSYDADLMIIGQDWASESHLKKRDECIRVLGQKPTLATNRNLKKFLKKYMLLEFGETWATDVFPFLKRKRMSERIPQNLLVECAKTYTLKEIEIIRPLMVVCLGLRTINAVRVALGQNTLPNIDAASDVTQSDKLPCIEIYGATHTGGWGTTTRGRKMNAEWRKLGRRLKQLQQKRK